MKHQTDLFARAKQYGSSSQIDLPTNRVDKETGIDKRKGGSDTDGKDAVGVLASQDSGRIQYKDEIAIPPSNGREEKEICDEDRSSITSDRGPVLQKDMEPVHIRGVRSMQSPADTVQISGELRGPESDMSRMLSAYSGGSDKYVGAGTKSGVVELGETIESHDTIRKMVVGVVRNYFPDIRLEAQPEDIEAYESRFEIDPFSPLFEAGRVSPLDSVITRMGGKRQLKDWLIDRFPNHTTYVEPFMGSLQVLLAKRKRSRIEIVNDIDADMVHFFRYLKWAPEELADLINSTPTHEAIIMGLRKDLEEHKLSGIARAAAWFIHNCAAFNATSGSYSSSPSVLLNTNIDLELARRVADRLDKVDIRSTHWLRVVQSANKKVNGGVFFYLDPPYYETHGYETLQGSSSFGQSDQIQLRDACLAIHKMGNHFIQTNSWHPFLHKAYSQEGFHILKRDVHYSVAGKGEARGEKGEIIISNFKLEGRQGGLF